MNSKLSVFIILFTITNVMSAKNPCLNFNDWKNFKNNFSSDFRPYKIQFNDINHETKAYKILLNYILQYVSELI
jgi:hypothetical protein